MASQMLVTTGMAMDAAAVLLEISAMSVVKAANTSMVTKPPCSSRAAMLWASRPTAPVWISICPRAMPLAKRKYIPHMA